jgi:HPt (histidine-containing phosphotransfer) domain-containing protein
MPVAAPTPVGEVWTRRELVDYLEGDDALADDLVAIFLADCPGLLAALRKAVAGRDGDAIRYAAHALKGAVGNFTTGEAHAAAAAVERAGQYGDAAGAANGLDRLEAEFDALLSQMRREQEISRRS